MSLSRSLSRNAVRRRGQALLALTTSLGLAAAATAVIQAPAESADPAPDCAKPFPIASLVDGQAVRGKTVTSGTRPTGFTGEVIGVLDDGIAPGLDMVVMDLSSPEIDRVGGIWQGMSGSPVYAQDGRLIGAVAYGLAFGASPVAGITPFEDMDDYLATGAAAPGRVRIDGATARAIAQRSDVSEAQAEQGMRQLPMPVGVSGVSAERLAKATGRDYLRRDTYVVGRTTGAAAPDPSTVVAGGNIAAALSYGDITAAGVGTATSVCGGRVVGFGHPMVFAGETTLTLHPADALYIQEDPLGVPFKVANVGDPAGTITDDHLTGITGGFGALPDTGRIQSAVRFASRARTGTSFVALPAASAETTFFQLIANHDRVVDGIIPGSEQQTFTITGTDADGKAFRIAYGDRYTSAFDITFEASFDVADLVFGISLQPGVTIDSVSVDSALTRDTSTYTVKGIEQKRKGKWVALGPDEPAVVRAGKKLTVRTLLVGPSGSKTVPFSYAIPRNASGSKGRLTMVGGNSLFSEAAFQPTLARIIRAVNNQVRNDEVLGELSILAGRRVVERSHTSEPTGLVVDGRRRIKVLVR